VAVAHSLRCIHVKIHRKEATHHVNPRFGTLVDRRLETTVAVAALASAPRTLVLGVPGDAQGAVGVLAMRTQDLALVQRHVGRVHQVVAVPHQGDGRLVLARVRLVGVLQKIGAWRNFH
jgi:hypothetical protein